MQRGLMGQVMGSNVAVLYHCHCRNCGQLRNKNRGPRVNEGSLKEREKVSNGAGVPRD